MKTLQIYEDLVALDREQHRTLKLAPVAGNYAFARESNSVIVSTAELAVAALDFPCVFVPSGDGYVLAAVLGLRDNENLFVQADGSWSRNVYQPGFFRRYPFVLGEDEGDDRFTVLLDRAYPGFGSDAGEPLFDADGQATPLLEEVKRFLVEYRQQLVASQEFVNHIAALGLLQDGAIEYKPENGEPIALRGFKTVDEARLRRLDPAAVQELLACGWMGLIYAHLLSTHQVQRLAQRLDERRTAGATPADAVPTSP